MANELDDVKVDVVGVKPPYTIMNDMPVSKAAEKMLREKVHSIVVVDKASNKPAAAKRRVDSIIALTGNPDLSEIDKQSWEPSDKLKDQRSEAIFSGLDIISSIISFLPPVIV